MRGNTKTDTHDERNDAKHHARAENARDTDEDHVDTDTAEEVAAIGEILKDLVLLKEIDDISDDVPYHS